MIKIAPSILAADFAALGQEIAEIAHEADYLHVDVMDGVFVPNISIGIPVVQALRRTTDLTLDVHLMITKPIRFVQAFLDAGADILTFHLEADDPAALRAAIQVVKNNGKRVGLSIRPKTAASELVPYLPELDSVLIMTVEPGFGAQAFLSEQLEKIRQARELTRQHNPNCNLAVDGGIDLTTAPQVIAAGATVLVAGSTVFRESGSRARSKVIAALRNTQHS